MPLCKFLFAALFQGTMGDSSEVEPSSKGEGAATRLLTGKVKTVINSGRNLRDGVRRKLRQRLSGDANQRLRDALRRELAKPVRIQLIDKVSFSLGVLNLTATQAWLMLSLTTFWMWYLLWFPALFLIRVWTYTRRRWQYFLL